MSTTNTPKGAAGLRTDDAKPQTAHGPVARTAGGVAGWVDDRTGAAKAVELPAQEGLPRPLVLHARRDRALQLIILLLTGTFLTFWFVPSSGQVVYDGSYVPLQGVDDVARPTAPTLDISFDVRGGLLIRQIHHWAALIFVVSIMVHMFRVFFTGAFRKPREINWVIGMLLSMLAIVEGFAGYSLPDDLLSGTGLRTAEGFMRSIPVVGTYVSFFLFGGEFPGEAIIPRLFTVHVLLLPAIILGLFTAHMLLVFVHKHTQYPGPGPHQQERRRLPADAGLHRQGRRLLLHRLRRHRADRGARHRSTRSGCSARTTRPRSPPARSPTGTWASPTARCAWSPGPGVHRLGLHVQPERLHPGDPADPRALRAGRRLPVPRGLGHRRQARAPPARPPAQRPDPHRARRHGPGRSTSCCSSPRATTSSRSSSACRSTTSPTCCGSLSSSSRRCPSGHQADLPRPAAP